MSKQPSHLRFIDRTHRRWVAWRVVERAGIGGVIGAGVALLVVLVLVWRDEPAIVPAGGLVGLGIVAGAIWGWGRRPSLLETARLIDRQLGLHDLLSTTLLPQQWGDEAFQAIVREQARARCERISPNELVLRRLGSRQWGGIGLAGAMVFTIALMSGQPGSSEAKSDPAGPSRLQSMAAEAESRAQTGQSGRDAVARSSAGKRSGEDEPGSESAGSASQGAGARTTSGVQSGDGSGQSQGRTSTSNVPQVRQSDIPASSSNFGENASAGGPSNATTGSENSRGGGSRSGASNVTPWQSDSWSNDVAEANRKINSGQVPDNYLDLVKAYFSPEKQ